LNAEALPFVLPPGLKTPPAEFSEHVTTTIFPPAPVHCPIRELVEEPRPPSPPLEGRDTTPSTSSTSSTTWCRLPPRRNRGHQVFTRAEPRAVETVVSVLLEMKSKGEARAGPGNLPRSVLAKNGGITGTLGTGRRFLELIDLGTLMGWLETGPENSWIDVGAGRTEDIGSQS